MSRALAERSPKEFPYDHALDVRGKNCPLPIISTKKTLEALALGQTLKVLTSDRGSVNDFRAFSQQTGLDLLAWNENNGEFSFYIRKVPL